MDNINKTQRLRDLIPSHFSTNTGSNLGALLDTAGSSDQMIADLIKSVKEQMFVKTASRPYLDVLGSNVNISRPRLVGMQDASFRKYIPVMSYQPKQVKAIIDSLLSTFFFQESTTAFTTAQVNEPYTLQDGWTLEYTIDENTSERIFFNGSEFSNILAASASEVCSAINRQALHSYASIYYDNTSKKKYVRLFTNTVGSKGSVRIVGGQSNVALQFNGFLFNAGNGIDTQWNLTTVGDEVTMSYVGGSSPGISFLQAGDILISGLLGVSGNINNPLNPSILDNPSVMSDSKFPGNAGSFVITYVDVANNLFKFINVFGVPNTPGHPYTQTSSNDTKFFRPNKYSAFLNPTRAMSWETEPGKITVEMPASPPVVRRSLAGSAHINGAITSMANRIDDNTAALSDASGFPNSGIFKLQSVIEVKTRLLTNTINTIDSHLSNSRLQYQDIRYTYTSRTATTTTGDIVSGSNVITNLASVTGIASGQNIFADGILNEAKVISVIGNTVTISVKATQDSIGASISFADNTLRNITPALPALSVLKEVVISNLSRANNVVSIVAPSHGLQPGDVFSINGSDLFGTTYSLVVSSSSTNNVSADNVGPDYVSSTPGTLSYSIPGMASSGSIVMLTTSVSSDETRIIGPYIWDKTAPFVLSNATGSIQQTINAGQIIPNLNINVGSFPNQVGYVIIDYGRNNQEGPIKYLYKSSSTALALDPSYVFQKTHLTGASITALAHLGAHKVSITGTEYAPYITDPAQARTILENLILSVKSAGVFIEFIVRYPDNVYNAFNLYGQ